MYLGRIAVVCLAIVQHTLCNDNMYVTKNPILEFLHLDADSPSEYEFVKILLQERFHKRTFFRNTMPAGTRMRIRAFGKDVNLWLHPRDSTLAIENTPVYYSKYAPDKPGKVSIEQQLGLMKVLGKILEDPEHLASLVIGKDIHGRITVNGRIGSKNLVVRSLPKSVVNDYVRKRRSIDNLDDDSANLIHHVVYRTDNELEKQYFLGDFNETMLRVRLARSTPEVPNVIYPKILVVVDYSMYSKQGRGIYGFLEYILTFWNGVDLLYRDLVAPRVRLHISAIIIGMEPKGTPYISDNMRSDDAFEAENAMQVSRTFFYDIKDSIPLESYDIVHTTTRMYTGPNSNLPTSQSSAKELLQCCKCSQSMFPLSNGLAFGLGYFSKIVGKGFPGMVCKNSAADKRMDAISMTRDDGAFSGVITAAHELGHVFGLEHDAHQNHDCKYSNGFIMAFTPWYTTNSSTFSRCSLEKLQKAFDEQRFACMYEKPRVHGSRKLPKLMPGRVKHLEEQCSALGYGMPCNPSKDDYPIVDVCVNFFCRNSDGECKETGTAALAGTLCSNENDIHNRFCVHNRCVRVLKQSSKKWFNSRIFLCTKWARAYKIKNKHKKFLIYPRKKLRLVFGRILAESDRMTRRRLILAWQWRTEFCHRFMANEKRRMYARFLAGRRKMGSEAML